MNVGEVCNREVIIIDRDGSIRDAAGLMRKYHVGNVVVVEEKNGDRFPVGILTDRDIVLELIALDVDINAVTVGDAMSFELITAREEDNVMETIKRMRHKGVRRIPVVNDRGVLEGILAVDDLIDSLSEQLTDLARLVMGGQQRETEKRL
ncbi:CBS domain-containing protein [Desulfobacter latus]|uniref:CBS domain-containing protein n=1 Tax=Desulfobacter latus TaxID=2292 RepID=A0A850T3I4_9BACT|nr:CBS domain-containing protein [Desulfobacter latus]NWH03772.1 CBS domain-containing protein [Desulfobacter latus]